MNYLRVALLLVAAVCPTAVGAQAPSPETTSVPKSGFYVGIGGSANFADFGTQSLYNKGISDVFNGAGVQTSSGTADGPPIKPSFGTTAGFAPVFQLGYFRRFGDSNFLWGAKFLYNYLGNSSTQQNLIIPQYGSSSAGGSSTFGGQSVTGGYTVGVYHQTSFTPFVGYALDRSFFYAGAGRMILPLSSATRTRPARWLLNARYPEPKGNATSDTPRSVFGSYCGKHIAMTCPV